MLHNPTNDRNASSQVTYTNWARQEPNNYEGKSENCVEMYRDTESYRVGGTWNDALCSDVTVSFIFQVQPGSTMNKCHN